MASPYIETLIPFTEFPTCTKCASTRGRAEQAMWKYCLGAPRPGRGPEDACPLGETEHIHTTCRWCGHEFGMNCADAPIPEALLAKNDADAG